MPANSLRELWNRVMRIMSGAGPARLLAAYGGTTFLVYVETAGFTRNAPFLASLPLLALAAFTVSLNISPQAKYCTTASFFLTAFALYLQSSAWGSMAVAALLQTASNLLFLLSFYVLIRQWSRPITLFFGMLYAFFVWNCFSDLLFSIPTLVCSLMLCVASAALLVVASGSLSQNGSLDDESNIQTSFVRFVGAVLHMACFMMAIYNMFGNRSERTLVIARALEYIAQGLMFLANEREF